MSKPKITLDQIIKDQQKALGDSIKEGLITVEWVVEQFETDKILEHIKTSDIVKHFEDNESIKDFLWHIEDFDLIMDYVNENNPYND